MKTKTFLALFCLLCISQAFHRANVIHPTSGNWFGKIISTRKQALIHRSGVKYHVANRTGITI